MLNIFALSMMTATRNGLVRAHDVTPEPANGRRRGFIAWRQWMRPVRYIDPKDL